MNVENEANEDVPEIPDDLLPLIFSKVTDAITLVNVSLVCKLWRLTVFREGIWELLYHQRWDGLSSETSNILSHTIGTDWYHIYKWRARDHIAHRHKFSVFGLKDCTFVPSVSIHGNTIAALGADGVYRVGELWSGEPIFSAATGHSDTATMMRCDVSKGNIQVLTSSASGSVRLHQIHQSKMKSSSIFSGCSELNCIAVDWRNNVMYCGSDSCIVNIVDIFSHNNLCQINSVVPIYTVAQCFNGVLSAGSDVC